MPDTEESIEMNVPAEKAYKLFANPEEIRHFIPKIKRAKKVSDTRARLSYGFSEGAGELDMDLVEAQPHERVEWKYAHNGFTMRSVTEFQSLDSDRCRVVQRYTFTAPAPSPTTLMSAPAGAIDQLALHALSGRAPITLRRAKEYAESVA
ncbi:SRPBCC family protein [Streptomyces sp. NPDC101227]|uniref:SRPBCC family protein n=1 Tax=Streptomyces sp. NPDC101227 TaxID=3366136 RepID=UPI00380017EA